MKKIALTGIMGAGKSSVLRIVEEFDLPVLSCDEVNAKLLQPNQDSYQKIIQTFTTQIIKEDQSIDTQKLSNIVFQDKQKKQQLEDILHPCIKKEIQSFFQMHQDKFMVMVEVPLLFEVNWQSLFDESWLVTCNMETLLNRLQMYRKINKDEASLRIEKQFSQDVKKQLADVVISNDYDFSYLKKQVMIQLNRLKENEDDYVKKRRSFMD